MRAVPGSRGGLSAIPIDLSKALDAVDVLLQAQGRAREVSGYVNSCTIRPLSPEGVAGEIKALQRMVQTAMAGRVINRWSGRQSTP